MMETAVRITHHATELGRLLDETLMGIFERGESDPEVFRLLEKLVLKLLEAEVCHRRLDREFFLREYNVAVRDRDGAALAGLVYKLTKRRVDANTRAKGARIATSKRMHNPKVRAGTVATAIEAEERRTQKRLDPAMPRSVLENLAGRLGFHPDSVRRSLRKRDKNRTTGR